MQICGNCDEMRKRKIPAVDGANNSTNVSKKEHTIGNAISRGSQGVWFVLQACWAQNKNFVLKMSKIALPTMISSQVDNAVEFWIQIIPINELTKNGIALPRSHYFCGVAVLLRLCVFAADAHIRSSSHANAKETSEMVHLVLCCSSEDS